MRDFSRFEKRIIRMILEVFSKPGGLSVLGNVLEFELDPNLYIELKSETECPVRIKEHFLYEIANKYGNLAISELIKEVESKLLFTIKLISYLELENLLILSGDLAIKELGEKDDQDQYKDYNLGDPLLIKLLYSYSRKKLTPTEGLSKLIENEFRSDEEILIEKEFKLNRKSFQWTATSVIIAGIALLASILIPFFHNQTVTLDKKSQLYFDSVARRHDSIIIKNQTIKISIDKDSLK